MEKYLKYIFFFILGLVIYSLLKKNVIEGISPYNNPSNACNNTDNTDKDKLWEERDLRNYKNKGVLQPNDPYIKENSLITIEDEDNEDNENYYKKLCFKNILTDENILNNDGIYNNVMDLRQCKKTCNEFDGCGAISYNNNNSGETPKCCLFKPGYGNPELTDDSECFTKPNCNENENYYSFYQCIYDENKLCPELNKDINDNTGIFQYNPNESNKCSKTGEINLCNRVNNENEYCRCGTEDNNNSYDICEKQHCNEGNCSGTRSIDNQSCWTNTDLIDNERNIMKQDTDIITEACYCGQGLNNNIDYLDNSPQYVLDGRTLPGKCPVDNYCDLTGECRQLDDCVVSPELLNTSCKYNNNTICKFTNSDGYQNTVYEIDGNCNDNKYDICEKDKVLTDSCLCVTDDLYRGIKCDPGNKCTEEGCESLKCEDGSEPINGSKCPPQLCEYYSAFNTDPISSPCVCQTEINNSDSNIPFICPANNYCFDGSYSENLKGCKKLPPICERSNEPLNASCICQQDRRDNGFFICPKDNYCIDSGCKQAPEGNKQCAGDKVDNLYLGECCPTGKKYNSKFNKCTEVNPEMYNSINKFFDKIINIF